MLRLGKKRAIYSSIFTFFITIVIFGTLGGICIYAYTLYLDDVLTIGDIFAFLQYFIALMMSFFAVIGTLTQFAYAVGASDKVMQLIGYVSKINIDGGEVMKEEDVGGTIELKDVYFTYPCREEVEVLKGVNLKVSHGEHRVVAICGTSGCGKSSTIAMIERFYDPS